MSLAKDGDKGIHFLIVTVSPGKGSHSAKFSLHPGFRSVTGHSFLTLFCVSIVSSCIFVKKDSGSKEIAVAVSSHPSRPKCSTW